MTTKYPEITIVLTGEDGNAFSILARCHRALKRAGLHEEVPVFTEEATSDDYNHLLRTVMQWFSWE
jgi:ABC-type sugar transport system substrate-binding protein